MNDGNHPERSARSGAAGKGTALAASEPAGRTAGRVDHFPTPEEIAERVYELLMQELRIERERRGRWRDG